MTESNSTPPPEQAGAYPAPVQAAAPIPALPYASMLPRHQRPGILSAVGVISIIVGSISFLSSLMSGCQSGVLYAASKIPQTTAAPSTTFTTTTTGYSSSVTVYPSATPTPGATTTPATAPTGTNSLTASEVAGAVQRAQKAAANKLNTAQINALTTTLQDPDQTLVSPGTAWSPVRSANVNPDGSAFIMFTGGFASMDAQGTMTQNNLNFPGFKIGGTTCLMAVADAIVTLALAIYLFIAGILTLRSSPTTRKMHLIYAGLKIPAAVGGGIALGYLYSEMYGSMGAMIPGGATALQRVAFIYALVFAVIAMIYPIALLITMNTRGVRDFYRREPQR